MMLAVLSLVSSCSPETYSLDAALNKSDIHFDVVQDFAVDPGGNTVILTNKTKGVVLTWDYVTGKSNKASQTVHYAFKGTYTIKVLAVTDGGLVELDPVTITVTKDNLKYVDDPLWTALSGGVGKSKTWYLDLNAQGVSKYFVGPMYFSGNQLGWEKSCKGDDPALCWIWEAAWKDNGWIADAGDYGSMEFSLIDGPFVKVDHKLTTNRGVENGSYFLDATKHTLTMTNAAILQNSWAAGDAKDWDNCEIISLTEDAMQIAIYHKSKPEFMIFNFISKEYSDNWTPPVTVPVKDEGFNPTFAPGELLTMLTGGGGAGRIWNLDANGNPVDWIANGKGWTKAAADSRDWGWNDSWVAATTGSWIRFDQYGGKLNYTRNQNGVMTTGLFTIDEAKNEINLGTNTLIQNSASWMNPTTNVIKVVKAFNDSYLQKGIWFGTSYDAGKDEWLSFHYIIP